MTNTNPNGLYGLILAGGHSKRMKKDKSLINYHGKSQFEYCYQLLLPLCEKVFISNRKDQAQSKIHKGLPQIHDTFFNVGPLGGILSAMVRFPEAAWIVLACDLPFVNNDTLEILVQQRNSSKFATAYRSANEPELPEPLCAIYETKIASKLLNFFNQGMHCPRKILKKLDVHLINQDSESRLNNINDIQEYKKTVNQIKVNQRG